jgi:hypothetical protein
MWLRRRVVTRDPPPVADSTARRRHPVCAVLLFACIGAIARSGRAGAAPQGFTIFSFLLTVFSSHFSQISL